MAAGKHEIGEIEKEKALSLATHDVIGTASSAREP